MKGLGKKIFCLTLTLIVLTGIMPFGSRKVEAATTQIIWKDDDLDDIDIISEGPAVFCTKDGITVTAEADNNAFCKFTLGAIIISYGKMTFSCGNSFGKITGLEIICDPGSVKNFERDNPDWNCSSPDGYLHLVWEGEGNPEIKFQMTSEDDDMLWINPEKMIFTLVSDDEAETKYPLWVGGKQVTSEYLKNKTEGWEYDPDSSTLHLDGANITETYNYTPGVYAACIYSTMSKLTIDLTGNNTVGDETAYKGIFMDANPSDLTFTGEGSLTVKALYDGIHSWGSLTISDTDLTATSYDTVYGGAEGIHVYDKLTIDGSTVTASGGLAISCGYDVEITDSTVEANGKKYGAMFFGGDLKISGESKFTADVTGTNSRAVKVAMFAESFDFTDLDIVEPEEGTIGEREIEMSTYFTVLDKDGDISEKVIIAKTYTIRFVNEDGTELQSGKVITGEMPKYTGKTPTKPSDGKYSYTFKGWDKTITEAKADAVYTAVFESRQIPAPDPAPAIPYQIPKTGIE